MLVSKHTFGLSGSHRSTHIASDFGIAGARITGQTTAGVRIAGISHRSILKTPRFFASQANIAGFSQGLFLAVSCDFRSSEWVFASLANKLFRIASDLGVCDSNRIAHRGCIARFGPLSFRTLKRISENYITNPPPACYRSLSGPSGRSVPRVSLRVSPKTGGVRGSVTFGPGLWIVPRKCPETVPGVSKMCRVLC